MLFTVKRMFVWGVFFSFFFLSFSLAAQDSTLISLPKPTMEGGKPLMEALKERQSQRVFSPDKLSPQVLSHLLWAAAGMNRPGKRTIPSAMNWQEVDVYVATADGTYLYLAEPHALKPIVSQDLRALAGIQPYVKEAPVNLIYVADYDRMTIRGGAITVPDSTKDIYSAATTGCIGQNVYLFCASEGLATVIRAGINRPALAKAMNLRPAQKIILAQTVGYPKKDK